MTAPSETSVLRVGILGSGNIARVHAVGWNTYPEKARITAIADLDADRARAFSDLHTGGSAAVYPSLESMLQDDNIDVVDICLPHHLHTDAVIASSEAGEDLPCGKPLCTTP